jgi:hypothetical protein
LTGSTQHGSVIGNTHQFTGSVFMSGSLGIGTSAPSYPLHVYSTTAARILTEGTSNFSTFQVNNTGGTLYMGIDDSAGANFTGTAYGRFIYSGGAYPLILTTNGTERVRITSAGNVGIGTNSPSHSLDINGTTRIQGGGRFYMNNTVMLGMVLQHGDLANGDGSNTTETDAKATNGNAKKRASGASSNTFFYGPYITLPAGNYVAGFRMKVTNNSSSSRIVSIDVSNVTATSGAGALAPNNFTSSDAYQYFKIYFTVANPSAQIEFRGLSFVSGITDIFLDHILIMPNLMV